LREIPTPAITEVPAAVKFFGFRSWHHGTHPLQIDAVSSYLDLMVVLGEVLREGPAQFSVESARTLIPALPPTFWLAENEDTLVVRSDKRSFERSPAGDWTELAPGAALPQELTP
jgi:hypothetical protein